MAASILRAACRLLRDGVAYRDLGLDYFVRRDPERTAQRLAHRLRLLGYEVQMQKVA